MKSDPPRILVCGLGNIFLGDDGFGVEVAQRLLKEPIAQNIRVVDFGIRAMESVLRGSRKSTTWSSWWMPLTRKVRRQRCM